MYTPKAATHDDDDDDDDDDDGSNAQKRAADENEFESENIYGMKRTKVMKMEPSSAVLKQEPLCKAPVTPVATAPTRPRPSCSARFKRAQHLASDGDGTPLPLPSSAPATPNPPSVRLAPSGGATMYYTPTPPSPSMSHHSLPRAPQKDLPPVPSARPVARPLSAPEHSAAPESAVHETDADSVSGASSGAGDDSEGATNSGKYGMVRDPTTGLVS